MPDLRGRDDAIESHIPGLRRFARSLVRDPDRADDLVQESLVRALAGRPSLRSEQWLRSWLFAILYRTYLMQRRQAKRRGDAVPIDSVDCHDQTADPDGILAAADAVQALGRLSEEHRAVLHLVAIEDMSYAQTADAIGVPVGTVMSRLSRAREHLRKMLDGQKVAPLRRVK